MQTGAAFLGELIAFQRAQEPRRTGQHPEALEARRPFPCKATRISEDAEHFADPSSESRPKILASPLLPRGERFRRQAARARFERAKNGLQPAVTERFGNCSTQRHCFAAGRAAKSSGKRTYYTAQDIGDS